MLPNNLGQSKLGSHRSMNASRIRREWLVIVSRGFRCFAFLGLESTSRASTRYNMLPTTVSETPGEPTPEPAIAQRFHRSVEPPAFPQRFSRSTAEPWSTSHGSGLSKDAQGDQHGQEPPTH